MVSRIPPASPAAIMLQNSASNTFGCRFIASASDMPPSTSVRVCEDHLREILVLFLIAQDVETLDERQTGVDHHRELPREHGEVLRRHAAWP